MKRTNTGKNTEGGVVLGLSPKYSTTLLKASCELIQHEIQRTQLFNRHRVFCAVKEKQAHLRCLCIFGQFVQLSIAGLGEAFEYSVIMQTALSPDQIHALTKLLHVQQHILQRHCYTTEVNVATVTMAALQFAVH